MSGNEIKYIFKNIDSCNMCGSPRSLHKLLGRRMNKSQGLSPKRKIGITTSIVKCKVCDLIFSNPQPIPFDIQDHYGVLPEDYWETQYFNIEENILGNLIEKLKINLNFHSDMKALDIGSGIGKVMKALQREGFDTFGIEPSKQFYDFSISKMEIDPKKLSCKMIENVEFPTNFFDFITFGAVLEHLYDPSLAIEKSLKWLKSGGIIQIQVPSSNWLIGKLFNRIYKIRLSDYVSNLSPMHNPYHLYEFSLKSFQNNAKQHAYSIVDYEYVVCQTMIPKYFDFILKPLMKKTKTGMEIYVLLKKNQ